MSNDGPVLTRTRRIRSEYFVNKDIISSFEGWWDQTKLEFGTGEDKSTWECIISRGRIQSEGDICNTQVKLLTNIPGERENMVFLVIYPCWALRWECQSRVVEPRSSVRYPRTTNSRGMTLALLTNIERPSSWFLRCLTSSGIRSTISAVTRWLGTVFLTKIMRSSSDTVWFEWIHNSQGKYHSHFRGWHLSYLWQQP